MENQAPLPDEAHVVVTGGTGYLGRALVETALARGMWVTNLSRSAPPDDLYDGRFRHFQWHMDEQPPAPALTAGDGFPEPKAIIHLAHDWTTGADGSRRNVEGLERIRAAARASGIKRLVLASSVSAKPDALNWYGREKYLQEQTLTDGGHLTARIGLVYGGARQGQWGTLCRLAGLPVPLPMVAPKNPVQPIHISDVADGLLATALVPNPSKRIFIVASESPLAFGEFLKAVAAQFHGRRLRLIPVPANPVLALLKGASALAGRRLGLEERVRGLMSIPVLECAEDLRELGLTPRALKPGLLSLLPSHDLRRERLENAAVILRYVRGNKPSGEMLRRHVRLVMSRPDIGRLRLPAIARLWPGALALFEPIRPGGDLKKCLDMAVRLLDDVPDRPALFYDQAGEAPAPRLARLTLLALRELMMLPVRYLLARQDR